MILISESKYRPTISEEKTEKTYTSDDINTLCMKLSKDAKLLHTMLGKHPKIDSSLLKRVNTIHQYFMHITPIDAHLTKQRKKMKNEKTKEIEENINVSATANDATMNKAAMVAKNNNTDVNITEGIKLSDVYKVKKDVLKEEKTLTLKDIYSFE